jgi:hypothetical protein
MKVHKSYLFFLLIGFEKLKLENRKYLKLSIKLKTDDLWLFIHDWQEMPTGNEWNTIRIESGIRYTISYSISFTREALFD